MTCSGCSALVTNKIKVHKMLKLSKCRLHLHQKTRNSGFSLKVAKLPLPKNPNRKTPPQRDFLKSARKFHWFFACSLQADIIRVFGHCTWPSAESPDRGPRRNAHYTTYGNGREKSRMRTTYQNTSMRFGFFRACAFRAKNPECYGFSASVNGTTKNPGFLDFGFCQCKWAYAHILVCCASKSVLLIGYIMKYIWYWRAYHLPSLEVPDLTTFANDTEIGKFNTIPSYFQV